MTRTLFACSLAGIIAVVLSGWSAHAQEKAAPPRLDREALREERRLACIDSGRCDSDGNVIRPSRDEAKARKKKKDSVNGGDLRIQRSF